MTVPVPFLQWVKVEGGVGTVGITDHAQVHTLCRFERARDVSFSVGNMRASKFCLSRIAVLPVMSVFEYSRPVGLAAVVLRAVGGCTPAPACAE